MGSSRPLAAAVAATACLLLVTHSLYTSVAAYFPSVTPLPVAQILENPAGYHTTHDGRQFKARVYNVNGCLSSPVNGTGHYAGTGRTLMNIVTAAICTLVDDPVTGTPTYTSFQAFRIKANGFRFFATFTMEDIDAEIAHSGNWTLGWRETMTALGLSGGSIVRPILWTNTPTLVSVQDQAISGASLAEVGWTGFGDIPVQGVAYASTTDIRNIGMSDRELGDGHVYFSSPIEELLIVYALTQFNPSNHAGSTFTWVTAIYIDWGCICTALPKICRDTIALVDPNVPGLCNIQSLSKTPHKCDFGGNNWCRTADVAAWYRTSFYHANQTCDCAVYGIRINRQTSSYSPSSTFLTDPW
ncbi:hypothetical protein MMPV_000603 [Pyropia vietnamensis]